MSRVGSLQPSQPHEDISVYLNFLLGPKPFKCDDYINDVQHTYAWMVVKIQSHVAASTESVSAGDKMNSSQPTTNHALSLNVK